MSFFSRLGGKLSSAYNYVGKKVHQAGNFIGKKVKPVLHQVSDVAGSIAKYGAMGIPAVAGVPVLGELYAGGIGLAAGVSGAASGLESLAGAVASGNIEKTKSSAKKLKGMVRKR